MALVKFFRGLKDNYKGAVGQAHRDSIYFATDTKELLLNETAYGLSTADLGKLNGAVDSLEWVTNGDTIYLKATTTNGDKEEYTAIPLASASNAIIIGFNVRPDATAKAVAEREGVDVRLYNIFKVILGGSIASWVIISLRNVGARIKYKV